MPITRRSISLRRTGIGSKEETKTTGPNDTAGDIKGLPLKESPSKTSPNKQEQNAPPKTNPNNAGENDNRQKLPTSATKPPPRRESRTSKEAQEAMDDDSLILNQTDDFEDVFKMPEGYDDFGLEEDLNSTKDNSKAEWKERDWKEDELIFEDAEDLDLPTKDDKKFNDDKSSAGLAEIVLLEEKKSAKDIFEAKPDAASTEGPSPVEKKRLPIKDRLFNLSTAPGLNFLLNIKQNENLYKVECLLCDQIFEGKQVEIHLKSRDHLLLLLKAEKPSFYHKYLDDISVTNEELYQIVKTAESSLSKQILTTVFKATHQSVKMSRMSKIKLVLDKVNKKLESTTNPEDNKPQTQTPVGDAQSTEPFKAISSFKRVIILASSFYAEQLKPFAFSGLVEIHTFKVLTLQAAREHIEKHVPLRPPSVLYLLFLGVNSFASESTPKTCMNNKCQTHLKQLFLKPEFMNAKEAYTKSGEIVRITRSFMISVNKSLPSHSKVLVMPPVPVELLTFSNQTHLQIHEKFVLHPSSFLMNPPNITALEGFYHKFCTDFVNALIPLVESDGESHPFTKYMERIKISTELVKSGIEGLCKNWKVVVSEIITMMMVGELSIKYNDVMNSDILNNEPKLIDCPKVDSSDSNTPLCLSSKTFDHVVFIGHSKVIHKVCTYDGLINSYSLVETNFPINLKSFAIILNKIKEKYDRVLFFVLGDISMIGKKFSLVPCMKQSCNVTIPINSCMNTSNMDIKSIISNIVKMCDLISEKNCEALFLPLYPAFAINYKQELKEDEVHKLMHSVFPKFTYLFEGAAAAWFTASKSLKSTWTERVKVTFRKLHDSVDSFNFFIEMQFPLLRWQDFKQPIPKVELEVEKAEAIWKDAFLAYLYKLRPKENLAEFAVVRNTLSQYEAKMSASNASLVNALSKISIPNLKPFKNVILIGEAFFLSQFQQPNITKRIHLNLQDPNSVNPDNLLSMLKGYDKETTACFLFFNATSIVKQEIAYQRVCSYEGCRIKSMISTVPGITFTRNRFFIMRNIVTKLSKSIPTFVLPLYPSLSYTVYPKRLAGHNFAHVTSRPDLCFCAQSENDWIEYFQNLAHLWNEFLETNHNSYATSLIVKKYLEERRTIQLVTFKDSDMLTAWTERNVWKSFVKAFIDATGTLTSSASVGSVPLIDLTDTSRAVASNKGINAQISSAKPIPAQKTPTQVQTAKATQPPQKVVEQQVPKTPVQTHKNVVCIENASKIIPIALFQTLANEIEPSCLIESKDGYIQVKFKQHKSAEILTNELDNLRVADCILRASVIQFDSDQPFVVPKTTRIFPKIYQKFFAVIISNILSEITSVRDPATYKVNKCTKNICKNAAECHDFHGAIDRRRNPFQFIYQSVMCSSGAKTAVSCRFNGLKCYYSHNIYEQYLHPSEYQTIVCPSESKEGTCAINPICKFIHRSTPELFFHKLWQDRVVFGLKNCIPYVTGSIRARCKRTDNKVHKNLFISPDPEIVRLVDASIKTLCIQHRLVKVSLIGTANINCNSSQMVLGTLTDVLKNGTLLTRPNRFCCIIVDDIATILDTPALRENLVQIFNKLKAIEPNFASLNKVFIADNSDNVSICNTISQTLNVELETPNVPPKAETASPQTTNGISLKEEVKVENSQENKKRSGSPCRTPPTKLPKLEPAPSGNIKKEFTDAEQITIDEVNEEFAVYEDVPEMHPNYEKYYESFMTKYKSMYPKIDNEKHKDYNWKKFWEVEFAKLKQQELEKQLAQAHKRKESVAMETEESVDFSVAATLDLLEDFKGKLGVLGNPLMKFVVECRSKGTNTPQALGVFAAADAQRVLNIVSDRFSKYCETSSVILRPVFKTASEWTKKLIELTVKETPVAPESTDIMQNLPFDLEAIAKVTKGKPKPFILEFIKSTLSLHGIDSCSERDVHKIFHYLNNLQSKI